MMVKSAGAKKGLGSWPCSAMLSHMPAMPAPASVPVRLASPKNPEARPRASRGTWSGITP